MLLESKALLSNNFFYTNFLTLSFIDDGDSSLAILMFSTSIFHSGIR